jgi:polyisoprenoid-binding protein YceI
MKRFLIYTTLVIPAVLHAQPTWDVEQASILFEIKNAGFPVLGSFEELEADIRFDPDQPARSAFTASVDASTVRTGIRLRDRHLQMHDYFDVANHPRIHMECVRIEEAEAG